MIENIIHINREEFDRLSLLTKRDGYIAATFNIATQDKFPLHKIHYVFENINPGETYDIDTTITREGMRHIFKMVVFHKSKCVGIVSATMKDYDPVSMDWGTSFKAKAIQRGKDDWLKEVALMTVTTNMMVAFAIINSKRIFQQSSGKHRLNLNSKSDSDEIIYSKLKALTSKEYAPTDSTGKGTSPQHEFDVRGHVRHYKSGKEVYVKPYTKCKGRGTKVIHEYELGGTKH